MFEIKYGPETLDTAEDWEDATIKANDIRFSRNVRVYILDKASGTRYDSEDWENSDVECNCSNPYCQV